MKYTERDICSKFVLPSLIRAGWNLQNQIREEVSFTDGRIYVSGTKKQRGKRKRADFILYLKPNIPLAIIEAKDDTHSVDAGIQQGINYSEILDIPFVFSTNGKEFLFHDKTTKNNKEKILSLENFPSPSSLWEKYKVYKQLDNNTEKYVATNYFIDSDSHSPRYYQQIAINRTIESISKNKTKKNLLVMATGTGKTYVAFQIIYRLWKAGLKKRILYLADRTALIDQTVRGDFRHFKDSLTVIKKKKIDKAYNIYLSLYQGLSDNEDNDAYKQFSQDFFDLVIVDECHRGSARDDSKWREILDYFKSATHLGLTATPKETKDVSSTQYFGDPIYTYSLKQGISDGFLAPYKVVKVTLDIDTDGWRPPKHFRDKSGDPVEDKIYTTKDFDKKIIVEERRKIVANKISEFLKSTNSFDKTIVFCVDIEHASAMRRELVNLNPDQIEINNKYIMQITGDNDEGKLELDNFINPSEPYPVIATTSKLMTTGIDAQTCKLIVLDTNIGSSTEFKQIIGRGTRINENFDKYYFTIMDFRNATSHFADKDFDGNPIQIKNYNQDEVIEENNFKNDAERIIDDETGEKIDFQEEIKNFDDENDKQKIKKIVVNGIDVKIINERVQYIDENGEIITRSLLDYTKTNLIKKYKNLNFFLEEWNKAERKKIVTIELEKQGIIFEALNEIVGKNFDPFDLVCHIAFDQKPLTRKERSDKLKKKDYFNKYSANAKLVIDKILDKYCEKGIEEIENPAIITVDPLNKLGTPHEIINHFGDINAFNETIKFISKELYA